ncbi:hypothetical protein JRG19_02465 [Pseudoclavibacter alba]|uniref:hypothetical protein n=1 Tax=Pseudoclavibacter albus TaxID=272241 RepID=UPI0019CF84A0|nr:hypothetical protein [Pseudoclavibacter alba]MBN6777414.1 hypothetical protein [Pseudoclavibacter alba]
MKNTISTKDGTLAWEDARKGDYVVYQGLRYEVFRTYGDVIEHRPFSAERQMLIELGAHLERDVEEHPHDLIPEEPWTHVIFGDGRHAVRNAEGAANECFWAVQDGEFCKRVQQATVQAIADEQGFVRLVPETEVEEAHMEGWKQGIREASSLVTLYALGDRYSTERMYANERIQGAFPTAFEQEGGEK